MGFLQYLAESLAFFNNVNTMWINNLVNLDSSVQFPPAFLLQFFMAKIDLPVFQNTLLSEKPFSVTSKNHDWFTYLVKTFPFDNHFRSLFLIISVTYGKRDVKTPGELSIVGETFSFFMMVCEFRKIKRA